ncbi:RING-H2 finger protein ATL39-like [Rhododendron vialii]|uniref:RING-H2 finger protein ATL39-like n=1 Tax=Rhododendron vialii TaxID=182163 RepID=UPI00265E9806|nr:RING-H2 finger protein ATL39-like [Rhododendron vialii]
MVQLFTSSHHPVIRAILLLVVALALHLPYAAAQADSPHAAAQADSPLRSPHWRKHISDDKIKVNPTLIIASLIGTFIIMGCVSVLLTQHCIRRQLTLTALESHGVSATNRRRRRLFGRLACTGLDPSIIDALPTFVYSEVKKDGMISLECTVCLSEFENAETLRLLPRCCHVFHPDCIEAWLSTHVTCPVCRSNLAPIPDAVSREPETEPADSVGINDSIVDVV